MLKIKPLCDSTIPLLGIYPKETKIEASVPISSVQFSRSVVSDSLRPHELQYARPPCPSPAPGVHPNSRASNR